MRFIIIIFALFFCRTNLFAAKKISPEELIKLKDIKKTKSGKYIVPEGYEIEENKYLRAKTKWSLLIGGGIFSQNITVSYSKSQSKDIGFNFVAIKNGISGMIEGTSKIASTTSFFYKSYLSDSFYLQGGLSHRRSFDISDTRGKEYTYQVSDIGVELAIGNQWTYPNGFVVGVVWVGTHINGFKLSEDLSYSGENKNDFVKPNNFPTMTTGYFLNVNLGYSF